ncbi:hypothetical protein [Methanobrevibacter sp. DSM 116169]|uniref:hypothetical protein n=1 Tax=Methanobrevibacter sp. DSM 116169 TaxID=3242727 RepID=UPI0038FBEB78
MSSVSAAEWQVDNNNYTSVIANDANDGDIIEFLSGNYETDSTININKELTLKANGEVNLSAKGNFNVLSISKSNVEINGFNIIGVESPVGYAGIYLAGTSPLSNITIYNNHISNIGF